MGLRISTMGLRNRSQCPERPMTMPRGMARENPIPAPTKTRVKLAKVWACRVLPGTGSPLVTRRRKVCAVSRGVGNSAMRWVARRCQPIRKKANDRRGVRLDPRTPGFISIRSFPDSRIESREG